MPLFNLNIASGIANGAISVFFLIAFIAVIGGVICISIQFAKKRSEEMHEVAKSLEMSFDQNTYKPVELGLNQLDFFKRGRSQKVKNLIRGSLADTECMLFDYRYSTGSGKNSRTHNQTVVAFKIRGVHLPQFTCKPEHFFHKFADMFGYVDINFDHHPIFSKTYRLNGENEPAVRAIFNDNVISYLESANEKPWSVDGSGEWLLIYRANMSVKTDDCSQFLLEGSTLLNEMTLT